MSGAIVNNILAQINQQPNSKSIKKLLLLKLESEFWSTRGVIEFDREPYVAVETKIHNFGDPIPVDEVVVEVIEPQTDNVQEVPKVEGSSDANV